MPQKLLAFGIMGALMFVGLSKADERDKKTTLTVNEPLIIPGQQLQPGKYVMKLFNSQSDRHIVQVFNEDQSQLIATIYAIANTRTNLTSDTALMYWETPAGPALRSWFFPGDHDGQEFAYPKDTANRIVAANAGAKVPVVDEAGNFVKSDSTELAEGRNTNANTFAERTDTNARATAAQPAPSAERTDPGARVAGNTPPPIVTPQPGPAETPRQDNTLLAQNQPAPNPVQPAPANNGANNNNANTNQLPQTASPLGWALSFGLISVAGAFLMRRLASNS